MTTHITAPRRFRRLKDRVAQCDREYFAQHPGETVYVRPYVPGETWPFELDATHVVVEQLAPGVRVKLGIVRRADTGSGSS